MLPNGHHDKFAFGLTIQWFLMLMTQSPSQELLTRARQILSPQVETVERRRALLSSAFWGHSLQGQFEYKGSAYDFATNCITQLLNHGFLPSGEHALARLLQTLRDDGVGLDQQIEIDALIRLTKALATIPRQFELDYLEWLKADILQNLERYTPIGGGAERKARMQIVCGYEPFDKRQPSRQFVDAVKEINSGRRAVVLLGRPGGGKTTILWKLAEELVTAALQDAGAPIPLLIPLGFWDKPDQPLTEFIAEHLNESSQLGRYLDALLSQKRAALLLDGLNELPVAERDFKYPQVRRLFESNKQLLAVVSCRQDDYVPNSDFDLGCDRINIFPLDVPRIRQFAERYLPGKGDEFFWTLAGEQARYYHNDFLAKVGIQHEDRFWEAEQPPHDLKWTYPDWNKYSGWAKWIEHRDAGLITLARNPYMLLMLVSQYNEHQKLPDNRGDLFRQFVEALLKKRARLPAEQWPGLIEGLSKVAYAMQSQRAPGDEDGTAEEGNALTVLPLAEVRQILDEPSLKLANSANLLNPGEQVRFTHQLLQEYFAAHYLNTTMSLATADASALWPADRWWRRTNWEEVAILLAGVKDCSEVVKWIADANPLVAASCALRSGADPLPVATLEHLRELWLPRLDNLVRDTHPQARAAIGRALALLDLDNRPNVTTLSGIEWKEIPAGEFKCGDESESDNKPRTLKLPTFYISRFPITQAQFQIFLDDPEGAADPRWFAGLTEDDKARRIAEPYFKFANHPRDNINWYQAMAFCRWWSWRAGKTYDLDKVTEWEVRLPTEFEWERAARGRNGLVYPYGNDYDLNKGNTGDTGIGQTSAVGIFPNGASP
ncbi:MAG: SUMF1/EgtB/PvdO family nonheme iron enzyme, partial [Acidobacteriota bacterium]